MKSGQAVLVDFDMATQEGVSQEDTFKPHGNDVGCALDEVKRRVLEVEDEGSRDILAARLA